DRSGPVVLVDMKERADASHRVRSIRQRDIPTVDLVVAAENGECELVSRWNHDRGRENFHVEFDRFMRCQWPKLIVGMPGPVGEGSTWVELAMRRAQPAETDRYARIVRADEGDFLAGPIEDAQHREEVGVCRFG